MRDGTVHVFVLAALVFVIGTAAHASERLALLIGNSRYEHLTPLRNPENDVRMVARSLGKAGFRTFVSRNLTRAQIRSQIANFVSYARRYKDPVLLFYFAGHGVQTKRRNYMLPVDAQVDGLAALPRAAIHADALLEDLSGVKSKLNIVVLDACRDDPFDNRTRGFTRGLSPIKEARGQIVAYSTAPGKVAQDGDAGTSPYASAFAESILVPGLSLEEVFRRVRRTVVERTDGKQEPWENSALYDPFVFIPKVRSQILEASEEEIWKFAASIDSAESYQRYLELFPAGTFSDLAKLKIDAINRDFSYRRKAELFPILAAEDGAFPGCEKYDYGTEKILRRIGDYRGQVVLVDLRIPLKTMFCTINKFSYKPVTIFKKNKDDCFRVGGMTSDVFTSSRVSCVNLRSRGLSYGYSEISGRQKIFKHLFANGGFKYEFASLGLLVPFGEHNFWNFRNDPQEGNFEDAFVRFTGLARVHAAFAEEQIDIYFEPVDPRRIGLTWKFENSLNELRNNRDSKRIVRLSK